MKSYLMYRDRDFDVTQDPPPHANALVQDLELTTLLDSMCRDDKWLAPIVRKAILTSLTDPDTIRYRQDILKDCLRAEAAIRQIYDLAGRTLESERKDFFSLSMGSPSVILHRSVRVLEMLVGMLRKLRAIADQNSDRFESEGFKTLFSMLQRELDDAYFSTLRTHLKLLQFRKGMLVSAQLGEGNKSVNYVLRKEPSLKGNWLTRLFEPEPPSYTYRLPDRDEAGARSLWELQDRGMNLVGNALAQSTDHVVSFFKLLRTDLAFYIGCLNLHAKIIEIGGTVCFPEPAAPTAHKHSADGLYDVCLTLKAERMVVGNEVNADNKDLLIVTGANQGGKTTFLRSIGLAQLMMQCGMFVPAKAFVASVYARLFTHFKREEDTAMNSGKFDEELSRMSDIIDDIKPHSLLLFNESFSATNEREGSEIARLIVSALIDRGMKVFFVTHQYEFAHAFETKNLPDVLFLRAERQPDGVRTFKVREAPPLRTSYGEDLYRRIFAEMDSA